MNAIWTLKDGRSCTHVSSCMMLFIWYLIQDSIMLCICLRVESHLISSSLSCLEWIRSWAGARRCLLVWFLTVYYSVWQFSTTISQHRVVSDVSYLSQSFQVTRRLLTRSRTLLSVMRCSTSRHFRQKTQ